MFPNSFKKFGIKLSANELQNIHKVFSVSQFTKSKVVISVNLQHLPSNRFFSHFTTPSIGKKTFNILLQPQSRSSWSHSFVFRDHRSKRFFFQKPPAGNRLVLFESSVQGQIIMFSIVDILQIFFLAYWMVTFSSIEFTEEMNNTPLSWSNTPAMRKTIYAVSICAIALWLTFTSYNRKSSVSRLMLVPGGKDLAIETFGFMGTFKTRVVPIPDLHMGNSGGNYDRFYVTGERPYLLDLKRGKYYNKKALDSILNGKIMKYSPEKKM